jgi:acetoin utilization deacetylase AcuC-like enzyme
MRVFYTDRFEFPLPPGHRFPVRKYRRLRERVQAEGIVRRERLLVPDAASDAELRLVHTDPYLHDVVDGRLRPSAVRRIGFPWSPELVERSRRSVGATIAACRAALEHGVGASLAGGTHHAFPAWGEGYCVFNDVAVAVRVLQHEGLLHRVLVVDLDVHQGNGTAAIFAHDAAVTTYDVYADGNYPFAKVPSDVAVAVPDGTGDAVYLATLQRTLPAALQRSRPELVLYLAGADPYEGDRLGRLRLTKAGLAARDRWVLDACRAAGVPVAVTMAGGYAHDIEDTVAIHLETVRLATGSAP